MAGIAEQLRQAVLQAAIQGKLTEQLPEDGDARDLLAEIQAEKAKLIAEKKIKKEKPLELISEDETPFDIPENWKWTRLPEIATSCLGKTLNKNTDVGEDKAYLCSINVYWTGIDLNNVKHAKFSTNDISKYRLQDGDLLICEGGDIGRAAIWHGNSEMYYQNALHRVRFYGNISQQYFLYVLMLLKRNGTLENVSKGMTIKHLVQESLYSIIFPIPPLAEQHRIVARVDELMAKIDELEKVEKELNALHKAFPGDMKAALLQAAMQGKLTEQLPEDGNAEDLLKSIEAEKAKLIAEKKIKKQKALELISEEDAPLQIPSNWSWAYIGDIFSHNAGKALNAKNQVGNKHKYITTSNVYWDHFELDNLKEMYYTDEEVEKYSVKKGDLLVLEGGDIGRSAIWNLDVSYCIQNHLHCLRPYLASSTNVKYYYYLMMLYKQIGAVNGKGIAIQGLSANALHGIAVPVAPLAEQQRIVERLDKLLPLCDSLEEKL